MKIKSFNIILVMTFLITLNGCLFDSIEQPSSIEAGEQFTTVLNINSIAQEINNAHHGIVGVLHPIGWVFESGTFESSDAETPSGNMVLDPDEGMKIICSEEQYNNNDCPSLDDKISRPDDMEWTFVLSDVGDYYLEQTLFEVTLNFNTDNSSIGDFSMGYITTVNTWGMMDWLNTEDNVDNPNMTDTSMQNMVSVISPTASSDNVKTIPESFYLSQNFPNPFNPSTNIDFFIPSDGEVSLSIYDINGKVIHSLVKDNFPAGSHSLTFNGNKYSSGVYYYVLKTKAGAISRKMTLVK